MKKKLTLILALCTVCAMCASCQKKVEEGETVIVPEEDTTKTAQLDGMEIPGPDQTTTIISSISVLNAKNKEGMNNVWGYKEVDTTVFDTVTKAFESGAKDGFDYMDAVISGKLKGEELDALKAKGELKGDIKDSNVAKVTVVDMADGEIVDLKMSMALIDDVWYVLDVAKAE